MAQKENKEMVEKGLEQEITEIKEVKKVKDFKNLTLTELKKKDKDLNKQGEFFVDIDGDTFKLTHDLKFRNSKKQKLLEDTLEFFQSITEETEEMLAYSAHYIALLMLKHFSSLDVSDDVNEAFALLRVLIDLEVLDAMLGGLPEDEVLQVNEMITETLDNVKKNMEETEAELDRLAEEVENPEVKELIKPNGEENNEE